ncbi:laccase-11-like [Hibiscus syriacus]|uniref:Laccase-11-like n=1 Tax=Hibiscus syriacus TaxID=106335 RepID=A0A6A3AQY6_HIBSY|nr:laccase-11-like [Hibiscus syriacus]
MSLKSIMRELKEMKDGIHNISKRGGESKLWRSRTRSHVAPDRAPSESKFVEQSLWANLPPELLLNIIQRVEDSETAWPARAVVVFCAAVCRSWREITKEIVKTPEQCGRLTFPISLKQPGPRESPIQCYIRRTEQLLLIFCSMVWCLLRERVINCCWQQERSEGQHARTSLYHWLQMIFLGLATPMSNFLGTKFTMYDSQPPCDSTIPLTSRSNLRFHSKQVSPRLPACNYNICTVTYRLNVLRARGPRRMHCVLQSIPISAIQEGGSVPTPLPSPHSFYEQLSPLTGSRGNELVMDTGFPSLPATPVCSLGSGEPLTLKTRLRDGMNSYSAGASTSGGISSPWIINTLYLLSKPLLSALAALTPNQLVNDHRWSEIHIIDFTLYFLPSQSSRAAVAGEWQHVGRKFESFRSKNASFYFSNQVFMF